MDQPEAEAKDDIGQLQPSVNIAIAESSETKGEVNLFPPQGSPEPSIDVEDKTGLLQNLPVVASTFPEHLSSSEPEISLIDVQDNNFSAEAQIGTHTNVDSSPVYPAIFSVKVAGAQGIVL